MKTQGWKGKKKHLRRAPKVFTPAKCFEYHNTGNWATDWPKRRLLDNFGYSQTYRGKPGGGRDSKSPNEGKRNLQGHRFVSEALSTSQNHRIGSEDWVLDIEVSEHICHFRQWFTTYEELDDPKEVRVGYGDYIKAHGKGCINIKMRKEQMGRQPSEGYFIRTSLLHQEQIFLSKAEKQCPAGVKILRTGNGLEFINQCMKELMNRLEVRHQFTVTYMPEQNGTAECENWTAVEAAPTILIAKGSIQCKILCGNRQHS